jgi:Salmonella virulence plasmid 65kDa B protein
MAENDATRVLCAPPMRPTSRTSRQSGLKTAGHGSSTRTPAQDAADTTETGNLRRSDAGGVDAPSSQKPTTKDLLPGISLRKGGDAIGGLGEKFAANPATGTSSLVLPPPRSQARFIPKLQLKYDSGSGDGPLGFGWSLNAAVVTRKTHKGLPRYEEGTEPDLVIFAEQHTWCLFSMAAARLSWLPSVKSESQSLPAFYLPADSFFTEI